MRSTEYNVCVAFLLCCVYGATTTTTTVGRSRWRVAGYIGGPPLVVSYHRLARNSRCWRHRPRSRSPRTHTLRSARILFTHLWRSRVYYPWFRHNSDPAFIGFVSIWSYERCPDSIQSNLTAQTYQFNEHTHIDALPYGSRRYWLQVKQHSL